MSKTADDATCCLADCSDHRHCKQDLEDRWWSRSVTLACQQMAKLGSSLCVAGQEEFEFDVVGRNEGLGTPAHRRVGCQHKEHPRWGGRPASTRFSLLRRSSAPARQNAPTLIELGPRLLVRMKKKLYSLDDLPPSISPPKTIGLLQTPHIPGGPPAPAPLPFWAASTASGWPYTAVKQALCSACPQFGTTCGFSPARRYESGSRQTGQFASIVAARSCVELSASAEPKLPWCAELGIRPSECCDEDLLSLEPMLGPTGE